jgi:hypothetical protein
LKKFFVIGLVILVLYTAFLNSVTANILFSNRSAFSKSLALGEYAVTAIFKLLWKILLLLGNMVQYLFNRLVDLWYSFSDNFSPPYDIRSSPELYQLYQRVEQWSGLPWQVFWGIHAEETDLGKNLGSTQLMRILPEDQKKYFLRICRELRWDPYQIYGSHKGAIGPFQFLPETWVRFAVDGDGDGRRDPFDLEDAAYSAANYLLNKGALDSLSNAVWHYNQDNTYVRRVMRYLR